nr:hypothetical protein LSAT_0X38260 [Ipomoea batatas]
MGALVILTGNTDTHYVNQYVKFLCWLQQFVASCAAKERIEDLEGRQQALRAEQQALIVQAVTHGHRGY